MLRNFMHVSMQLLGNFRAFAVFSRTIFRTFLRWSCAITQHGTGSKFCTPTLMKIVGFLMFFLLVFCRTKDNKYVVLSYSRPTFLGFFCNHCRSTKVLSTVGCNANLKPCDFSYLPLNFVQNSRDTPYIIDYCLYVSVKI